MNWIWTKYIPKLVEEIFFFFTKNKIEWMNWLGTREKMNIYFFLHFFFTKNEIWLKKSIELNCDWVKEKRFFFSNEWIELNEVYIKIGWNNWLKMIFSFFLHRHKWCLENRMVYFFDFFFAKRWNWVNWLIE